LFSVHHLDHFPEGDAEMRPKTGTSGRNIGQDFSNKDGWSMYHGKNIPGFPYHPHRGFETITVVEQGLADHSDSLGATGRFGGGDVQWMTAGKGVQHSEMFPLTKQDQPNTLELFQIWLNLPKKSKMVPANYQMLWSEDIPVVKVDDANGKTTTVKVIAGQWKEVAPLVPPPHSWASEKDSHLAVWLIKIPAGGLFTIPKTEKGVNRVLYLYKGNGLTIEGQNVKNYHSVQVDPTQEIAIEGGAEEVSMLLLQGRPIGEPVAQYGPFVMNTQQEIQEAFREYQLTQFGGWPWEVTEVVHPASEGRFAKYPDGSVERK
jgi:quercetin 2,3-dioxygenase